MLQILSKIRMTTNEREIIAGEELYESHVFICSVFSGCVYRLNFSHSYFMPTLQISRARAVRFE